MAAAAGILANGVTEILKKLSSVLANEIILIWDSEDELKNLQTTLNMIMAVMEDAEKKQISNASVRLWMEDLKSIAYDAEDILDEYAYEVCKREKGEKYKSKVFNKVRNIFSNSKPSFKVIRKLAHQIKEINERFKKIANRKHDLGLQTIEVGSSSSQHELMMKNRETNSFVPEDWKIVGRENDKSTLIKMLLLEEEENSTNNQGGGSKHVSVIPIVGMGGLGKTTMAQQVYNDEVVQKHFQLKIWICVSDPFDIKKLYKSIANSIGKCKEYDDATTMNDITRLLRDAFTGNKFILVLDDVWNEKAADWNNFKKPFMVGREGSKILVTTRNEKVALIMVDKFLPYQLGILTENDCWYLFKEITFGSVAGAEETPNLVEIGKVMVNRCGGLPLAVIFLGSLMRSKKKEEEWKIIRDTKLWHESREGKNSEILPSLRLSYDYLPSHLKLCFSYCCLFAKDFKFHRETLIRLWMAEGFLIETPGENMLMEEIGNEYFQNLLCNFFFQDVEKDEDGNIATCKMHDLVHDLARSVVGKHECLIVENAHDIDYISEKTRRLHLLVNFNEEEMLPKVLKALKNAKKLRTIFVLHQIIYFDIGKAFKENKRLRVVNLNGFVIPGRTSSSIGGLKHLRYLSVYGFCFPKGIGRLRLLNELSNFDVGDKKKKKKNACVIQELEGLNLLRGSLSIFNLQNVTSGIEACRANLEEKKNIRRLNLCWLNLYWLVGSKIYEDVLEGLRPHPNLRTLWIDGFVGPNFPRWIQDSSCLPNLVKLELRNCYCEQIAGFGALPSLRYLILFNLRKVECLGSEFYYSAAAAASTGEASTTATTTTVAFPSLKKLTLEDLNSLKEWVVPSLSTTGAATTNYCFPLLEEINIRYCPELSTITPTTTIFPSLKVLNLEGMDGRAAETLVTNNLNSSFTSLRLRDIPNLVSLPHQGLMENNITLLSLVILDCPDFKGFLPPNNDDDDDDDDDDRVGGGGGGQQRQQISQEVSSTSSLQSLKLYHCPALRFYPNILGSLTSLRTLEIQECKESSSVQDYLTCRRCRSSSSSSSLEHLEHVLILKNMYKTATEEEEIEEEMEEEMEEEEEDVVFEWRKPEFF